jgi:hypothetical protein
MLDNVNAGQKLQFTVKRDLRRGDIYDTVQRLMRLDPDNKRALKKAQEHRMRTLKVRSRGGRPFEMYQNASKVCVPVEGASFSLEYFPHIRRDIESVQHVLDIKTA